MLLFYSIIHYYFLLKFINLDPKYLYRDQIKIDPHLKIMKRKYEQLLGYWKILKSNKIVKPTKNLIKHADMEGFIRKI